MRVLLVGYKNPAYLTIPDFVERTLREMGHEVVFVDYRGYRLPGRLRARVAALESWDVRRINALVRARAEELKPALLLVAGGHTLAPETIRAVRSAGAVAALWVADYPLLYERYRELAPHFDRYFLSGTDGLERHRADGNERGRLLPFACVPELHRPVELTPADSAAFGCDVSFFGTAFPERVALLEKVAGLGVEVRVWGVGWDRLPRGHSLRASVRGGALPSADCVKLASASKISFNFMGTPTPTAEWMCNSRVFELLGCGAFQLVDAKKDVLLFFKPGRELACFEDEARLLEQVRHYLAHPDERRAIARAAREAALSKHTYRHRMAELLEACGFRS